jgi:putative ABC transport system permease protein
VSGSPIPILREWFSRFRTTLGGGRSDRELEEELQLHLDLVAEDGRRRGLPPAVAARDARMQVGGPSQAMEALRDQRGLRWLDELIRDFSFAVRLLIRTPACTLAVVTTLALTVGACTAIYSVVYAIVLRPLPYPNPGQLVQLHQVDQAGRGGDQFSDPNFEDLRDQSGSFRAMAEFSTGGVSVMAGEQPLRERAAAVSRDFFDVFATSPARGRRFSSDESRGSGPRAALVSDRMWREDFGAAADLSAARLRINGERFAIVGVMPPTFAFPADVDVWTPRELEARNPFRTGHNWEVVGRLRDGVPLDRARSEATAIARRLKEQYGQDTLMSDVAVVPLHDELVGRVKAVLLLLQASVILLLAVACANLANVLLARASARRRELAIRTALGATWIRVVLPLIAESLIVSGCGGALGVVIAAGIIRFTELIQSAGLPQVGEIRISWPVVLFAVGVTSATAITLSALATWRDRRLDVVSSLKDGQRGHTTGTSVGRLRSALIVAQLTVSVVLVIGAGLLGRSLMALLREDLGFRTAGRLAIDLTSAEPKMRVTPDGVEFDDPSSLAAQARVHERIMARLGTLPGVVDVGAINRLPLGGGNSNGIFLIVSSRAQKFNLRSLAALARDPEHTGEAAFRVASAGYFRVMGIPLISGRLFDDGDVIDAPHAAVISDSLARTRWPNQNPIGSLVQFGGMDGDLRVFTIVGVVGDVRERGFDAPPQPTFYADYRQRPLSTFAFTFVAATASPPTTVVSDARRVIHDIAPEVPPRFRTMAEIVDRSMAGRRFAFTLAALFAGAALLLAVLGIYGVLAFLVTEGAHEFGIRIALGAQRIDIQRLVLGHAARLLTGGLALGIGVSLAATRLLGSVLFRVQPTDPATYIVAVVVVAVVSFAACEVPAIRATRADPARALRGDA